MKSCRSLGIWLIVVTSAVGCSSSTPEKKLLGKWICTPRMQEAVGQAIGSAAQGKEVNPLVGGVANFLGQKLAEATMSVEVDFHSGGTVFFRGNTAVLNLPPDSDGTWEISSSGPEVLQLRFGTETRQLEGKILFRDKDEFTMRLKDAGAFKPQEQPPEGGKAQKPLESSLVFRRVKE